MESDEEEASMIPDEKPENEIGDQTALELNLLAQINSLETEEK